MGFDPILRVREFHDAFGRRDVSALIEMCSADCVISARRSEFEGDFVGHAAIEGWVDGFYETWTEARTEIERVETLADGRLAVLGKQMGLAEEGGLWLDAPFAYVVLFEGELVKQLWAYPSHQAALESDVS